MQPYQETFQSKGQTFTIRTPRVEDAAAIIAYMEVIDQETTFLSREPGEFAQNVTLEKRRRTPRAPTGPHSPHLRSSSGGTLPRRRFTHCCSCVMELFRCAIFSGLVRGAKLRRWAALSPSGGGYAVLPGRLGDV